MELITCDDLNRWADTVESEALLPRLIALLIYETAPLSTKIDMPWGSATRLPGYDGKVACEEETHFVSKGNSIWELGTDKNCKGKADSDYLKRKSNPLGIDPSECSFYFVTNRIWTKKDDWVHKRISEGFWKDVKAYDATALSQWLGIAPVTSRWLASQKGMSKIPADGVLTAEEYLNEWCTGPNGIKLQPSCVTAGRSAEKEQLLSALKGEASLISIKAPSREEAIAFSIAAADTSEEEEEKRRFFARTLIVDNEASYRQLSTNFLLPHIFIPRFDDADCLSRGVTNGHYVIRPLGMEDRSERVTFSLPPIDPYELLHTLQESGLSFDYAQKLSRGSGRKISVLRRLLGFPSDKTKWELRDDTRDLLPALLVGCWDGTNNSDRKLVERVSALDYNEYQELLYRWKAFEDAPLVEVDGLWRLTSPIDAWNKIGCLISPPKLDLLKECFEMAFDIDNSAAEAKSESASDHDVGNNNGCSGFAKEGLTQSLILMIKTSGTSSSYGQLWVDEIISDLLSNASGKTWIALGRYLPLVAEASPESFLKAVEESLGETDPAIMEMFEADRGSFGITHSGLLWALEELAWFPDYLLKVSQILLQLWELDPGGQNANRPLNSLLGIFMPWHPQTLASSNDRLGALRLLTRRNERYAWELLERLLPTGGSMTADDSYKFRWRVFYQSTEVNVTYKELSESYTAIIDLLLELFDGSEDKYCKLVEAVQYLCPWDRKKVIEWAKERGATLKQVKYCTVHALRDVLHNHRSYPDANWALPESDLVELEDLCHILQPRDVTERNLWLFDTFQIDFPEGSKYNPDNWEEEFRERREREGKERRAALGEIIREKGIGKTLEMRGQVKMPRLLGSTLADLICQEEDLEKVCTCLYDDQETIDFAYGFVLRKLELEGKNWIKSLVETLQKKGFSDYAIANILVPMPPSKELWEYVSSLGSGIDDEYWRYMNQAPYPSSMQDRVYFIETLISHDKLALAIRVALYPDKNIPTELLTALLDRVLSLNSLVANNIDGYEVQELIKELESRDDADLRAVIRIEIENAAMKQYYSARRPQLKTLEREMISDPGLFVDVLKWLHSHRGCESPLVKDVLDEDKDNLFRYHLMHMIFDYWKSLPGMREDQSMDSTILESWVEKVRALGEREDILDCVDDQIGLILSRYPRNSSYWPEEHLFKIIDQVNSRRLNEGYQVELFNSEGATVRGAYDGGDIERNRAAYYEDLESFCRMKFPVVAGIFKQLKEEYLHFAHGADRSAELTLFQN